MQDPTLETPAHAGRGSSPPRPAQHQEDCQGVPDLPPPGAAAAPNTAEEAAVAEAAWLPGDGEDSGESDHCTVRRGQEGGGEGEGGQEQEDGQEEHPELWW